MNNRVPCVQTGVCQAASELSHEKEVSQPKSSDQEEQKSQSHTKHQPERYSK